MPGLWSENPETPEGKYLVLRRDGTVPDWPWFVLGARDEAAPEGLLAYAAECERLGYDPEYVAGVRRKAEAFRQEFLRAGPGDPSAPRHRPDDPATIALMRKGRGA